MAKNRQDKLKEIQSTQMFSPIREISDGIICTKDDRFVKLMEFSPINFSLRSADEQSLIVSQFAMALRTMPDTLQFKIISRKADVTKFLDILEDHYNKETNPRCQKLQMEQMALIDAVGKSTGIFLRITKVGIERLQDISETDAVTEGVLWGPNGDLKAHPLEQYQTLWTQKRRPRDGTGADWGNNPWVWVLTFERITREEAVEASLDMKNRL